jgi:hypothetical protein
VAKKAAVAASGRRDRSVVTTACGRVDVAALIRILVAVLPVDRPPSWARSWIDPQ